MALTLARLIELVPLLALDESVAVVVLFLFAGNGNGVDVLHG
jgi:hypothetical protein